eukprot:m.76260 g.76260  ORF g.76260 m.76260 type:complete len:455 (+) comp10511_c0_seq1:62-1426(+)
MWNPEITEAGALDASIRRDHPAFKHKPSLMESFANTSADTVTDNVIDRFLFDRAARENEAKIHSIRRRYPLPDPAPSPPPTDGGDVGGAAANADVADLFAAVQAAPPAVAASTEVVVPVFREVAEGVGDRVASLTAREDADRHKRISEERVFETKLISRKSSVNKLLQQFQQQQESSAAPLLRRRGTKPVEHSPGVAEGFQEANPGEGHALRRRGSVRSSSPPTTAITATTAGAATAGGPAVAIPETAAVDASPDRGGAALSAEHSPVAAVPAGQRPVVAPRRHTRTSTAASPSPAADAANHSPQDPAMGGVIIPRNRFRSRAATAAEANRSAPPGSAGASADASQEQLPAWRVELLERRRKKKADQERLAAQATVLFAATPVRSPSTESTGEDESPAGRPVSPTAVSPARRLTPTTIAFAPSPQASAAASAPTPTPIPARDQDAVSPQSSIEF